jgi:hypothetical protein
MLSDAHCRGKTDEDFINPDQTTRRSLQKDIRHGMFAAAEALVSRTVAGCIRRQPVPFTFPALVAASVCSLGLPRLAWIALGFGSFLIRF